MKFHSFSKFLFNRTVLIATVLFVAVNAHTQVTLAFQGGEPGDSWDYGSASASGLAYTEATYAPNKTTGTKSIVCGGDTGGGNCFGSGSGNGPSVARTFTFVGVNLTTSDQFPKTLTFNWGNRFPACVGTGWDAGEDLVFVPYYDFVAQAPITIATGDQNAQFDIHTHTFTHTIPPCVQDFYFKVYVTTNRADELLFLDDVKLTTPQLNAGTGQAPTISGPTSLCPGQTITLTSSQSAGIVWSTGETTPSIAVNAPGIYTLGYPGSCGVVQYVSYTVDEGAGPTINDVNITPVSCQGMNDGEIEVIASGTNLQYSLNAGTPQSSNVFSGLGANDYQVTVSSASGCSTNVNATITAPVMFEATANYTGLACEGNTLQLHGTVNSAATVSYNWIGPNGFSSTAQNPSGITESGTYLLTASIGNCQDQTSLDIIFRPLPMVDYSVDEVCEGNPSIFVDGSSVNTPSTISEYSWDFGDLQNSNAANPEHVYETSGTYIVTLTVTTSDGCSSSFQQDAFVAPSPVADFEYAPLEIPVTNPTVQFTNTSTGADFYTWSFGFENETSTLENPEFTYPQSPNNYQVKLYATNIFGCIDSVTRQVVISSGVTYYVPNSFTPNGDGINDQFIPILTEGLDLNVYEFKIYNRWGEVVFSTTDALQGWDGKFDGSNVEYGTYVWTLRVAHSDSAIAEEIQGHINLIK